MRLEGGLGLAAVEPFFADEEGEDGGAEEEEGAEGGDGGPEVETGEGFEVGGEDGWGGAGG